MVAWSTQLTRIATELTRNDLTSTGTLYTTLQQHYQDAVEYYANEKFWFNSIKTTVNTVASTQAVTIPSTVQTVERVTIPANNEELREVSLIELPTDTTGGRPSHYTYYNDTLLLWPIPDAIYTLGLYGVAKVAAPTNTTDDTIWTNEAAPLLRAHTKMTLARGVFRDPELTQLALSETQDALDSIKRETAKRLQAPLRMPAGTPWSRDRYDWSLR